jgi:pimeloyl-ACP methyl ester carboxylesterase
MSTKVDIGVSTRTLVPGCRTHPGAILVSSLESNGCWLSEFDITHLRKLAAAITETGVATWALEYRRVGNPGGGWPGTFQDIARGTDHLRVLAKTYPLDLDRVIAAGHSAGGHLALWLAARSKLRNHEPFRAENPILPGAVLALAPAPDLAYLHEQEVEEIAVAVLGDDDLGLSVQVLQEFSVQATRSSRLARMSRAEATVLIEAFLRFPVQEMTLPLLQRFPGVEGALRNLTPGRRDPGSGTKPPLRYRPLGRLERSAGLASGACFKPWASPSRPPSTGCLSTRG